MIEDNLCDEDFLKLQIYPQGDEYIVSPNICYLGTRQSVDNFIDVFDHMGKLDKFAEDAAPLCVDFFTEKYFGPTFDKLRKETN